MALPIRKRLISPVLSQLVSSDAASLSGILGVSQTATVGVPSVRSVAIRLRTRRPPHLHLYLRPYGTTRSPARPRRRSPPTSRRRYALASSFPPPPREFGAQETTLAGTTLVDRKKPKQDKKWKSSEMNRPRHHTREQEEEGEEKPGLKRVVDYSLMCFLPSHPPSLNSCSPGAFTQASKSDYSTCTDEHTLI